MRRKKWRGEVGGERRSRVKRVSCWGFAFWIYIHDDEKGDDGGENQGIVSESEQNVKNGGLAEKRNENSERGGI